MATASRLGPTARLSTLFCYCRFLWEASFHPLTPEGRARDFLAGAHAPIVIEDDVFIGMNSLILKGVTIGRGSVVGAGSVVTRDVPAGVVVAGNPATVVRRLEDEQGLMVNGE